jgi:lipopolysaccharide transport system permease protein
MLARSSGSPLPDADVWVIGAETREGLGTRAREFWRYRRVLVFFWIKSVQSLYSKTRLGVSWLFIRTLLPLAVGTFVFGDVMNVSPGPVPYFIFFATGQLAWSFFDSPLLRASRGLESHRELLRKLYIPRVILPLGQMSGGLVRAAITAVVLMVSALYYRFEDGVWYLQGGGQLLRVPLAAALILWFAFSMSLWTSIWQARARDVRFVLRYVLGFWLYFTPVIYPLSMVPENIRWLAQLNPLTPPVELFKSGILPGTPHHWPWIAYSAALTMAVFAGGIWHFHRTESTTMDRM